MRSKAKTRAKLVYGQTVLAADLVAAASAYASLKPTLLGLDWLASLVRRDSIKVDQAEGGQHASRSAIGRVPVEVWLMVKQELVDSAVADARLELMAQAECVECSDLQVSLAEDAFKRRVGASQSAELPDKIFVGIENEVLDRRFEQQQEVVWETDWIDRAEVDKSCEEHRGEVPVVNDDLFEMRCREVLGSADTHELLARYGLYVPRQRVRDLFDANTQSGVVLAIKKPSPFGTRTPTQVWETPKRAPAWPPLAAFKLCPYVLKPDPGLDRRFAAFCNLYSVSALAERFALGASEGGGRVPADEDEGGRGGDGQAGEADQRCEPGWMAIWTN